MYILYIYIYIYIYETVIPSKAAIIIQQQKIDNHKGND